MERIARQSTARWKKGRKENERKAKRQAEKVNKRVEQIKEQERVNKEEKESREEWAERLSTESKQRQKIRVDVPLYGVTADREEMDALSLNPKFVQFQKVKLDDFEMEQDIGNTKIRWGEKEKVYKRNEGRLLIKMKVENLSHYQNNIL